MSPPTPIDAAFGQNASLRKRIYDAMNDAPQYAPLFIDIARYHLTHTANGVAAADEPAAKKRKLNGSHSASTPANQPRKEIFEVRDVSFSLPQRKKFHLGIAQYGTSFDAPETRFAIYAKLPATGQVDIEVPLDQYAYALRLPVPEKTTKQYNFVLLPGDAGPAEPFIWTINYGPLKSFTSAIPDAPASNADGALEAALSAVFARCPHDLALQLPDEAEFSSAVPESHRKSDTAYHVKAFRGSKDGFLFFLGQGIFFGFKKPLAFFALDDIVSVSYTSVLQRTFNLNVCIRGESGDEGDGPQEVEFSMLDQVDFAGIDAYIKRHELQDASLAESRRGKRVDVKLGRPAKAADATNGDEDDDGRTELEKAQAQLEDEEDEEEEDYAPSDDDDDASGSESGSDEDDDDDDEDDEDDDGERKNLVADELGSEAEDVEITDEDGEEEEEEDGEDEEDEEPAAPTVVASSSGFAAMNKQDRINPAKGFASLNSAPANVKGWGSTNDGPDPDDEDQL